MSRSLRSSGMGDSVPLLAFTPVFLLLNVVIGAAFCGEGKLVRHLLGGTVTVAGAALIYMS